MKTLFNIRTEVVRTTLVILIASVFLLPAQRAWAGADCPQSSAPTTDPPHSRIFVTIDSVRPNSDMEGDDDYVPYYDNHADIFGIVTINGYPYELPQIEENDFPHWLGDSGRIETAVTTLTASIVIEILENDGGLTGDDDVVDINPANGKTFLELTFDLCSLEVSGDIPPRKSQQFIEVSAGSDDDDATIRFRIGMADSRPVSDNDLALMRFDLIQVVPDSERLVANKPTVALVQVANNYPHDVTTSVHVLITKENGEVLVDEDVPLLYGDLQPGETRVEYLFADNPLTFPASGAPYSLIAHAWLAPEDSLDDNYPPDDCRASNDITGRVEWTVVDTPIDHPALLWAKVGLPNDIPFNLASDDDFDTLVELGSIFIRATYPTPDVHSNPSPFPLIPPPTNALDWLESQLVPHILPAEQIIPFWLTFELNHVAVWAGHDRLMGVLSEDWFEQFTFWPDNTGGLSLTEFAPHAVIFESSKELSVDPNYNPTAYYSGPSMALPAHELGHTFGLSVDSRMKSDWREWACSIDWPILGSLVCGAVGGYDEYTLSFPDSIGLPASGYWVQYGDEPTDLNNKVNRPQCDSHCFMGRPAPQDWIEWDTVTCLELDSDTEPFDVCNWLGVNNVYRFSPFKKWIDPADYDHLLDKFTDGKTWVPTVPNVLYISGMIASDDEVYLGQWYVLDNEPTDLSEAPDQELYGIRVLDARGKVLSEVGLPLHWPTADFSEAMPITFFAQRIPLLEGATRVEFTNRNSGSIIAERELSPHPPVVELLAPSDGNHVVGGQSLAVSWTAYDRDGDKLTYNVLVSPDGESWWPATYNLESMSYDLPTEKLADGRYVLKVLASDGTHLSETPPTSFIVSGNSGPAH